MTLRIEPADDRTTGARVHSRAGFIAAVVLNAVAKRAVLCASTTELKLDADSKAPAWIELIPPGPNIKGWDGRSWMLPDPNVVVQAFTKRGIQLPVDLEHSTHLKAPQGDPAPAMGHITKLEVRNGAVWGAVDWNDDGRREIESKHVKYISPAWPPSKDGKIHQLLSAGLTNNPNLTMPALNTSGGDDMAVHPDICDALDLDPDASVQDCLDAIHSLKPMGNSAFVPKADYEIVRNRVTTLETQLNGVTTAQLLGRATAAVDGAIAAGHVAPSSREYHLNTCKTEEGLAAFNAFWPKQPKLVQPSGLDTRPVPGAETNAAQGADGLTDNERAFCNKLGLTAEKFKANRVSLTDLQSPFVA